MKKQILSLLLITVVGMSVFAGCSNADKIANNDSTNVVVDATKTVQEVRDAVAKAYGKNYFPDTTLEQADLEERFGLFKDMYTEAVADISMMSFRVDTFVGIKAADGKVKEVETALNNYRNSLIEDGMQYPMNVPKIQASKVEVYGDYVFFVMLGAADDSLEKEEDMFKHFEKQNEIAEEAIKTTLGVK